LFLRAAGTPADVKKTEGTTIFSPLIFPPRLSLCDDDEIFNEEQGKSNEEGLIRPVFRKCASPYFTETYWEVY